MRRIIALAVLLFLSGCITFNVDEILGEDRCDYLLAHSSDIKLINSCYQDKAMLYAATGKTAEAIQACEHLLLVRTSEVKTEGLGTILTIPLDYLYDTIYPVWLYKSCIMSVAKTSRDKSVCKAINSWDTKLYEEEEVKDMYDKLVDLMQKGTGVAISGPGGIMDYLWPGYTVSDCEKQVDALIVRDEVASKSLFDIIES